MMQLFYYSLRCNAFSFLTISVQFVIHSSWFGELCSIVLPVYERRIQTLRMVVLLKLNKSVIFCNWPKKESEYYFGNFVLDSVTEVQFSMCRGVLFDYADKT